MSNPLSPDAVTWGISYVPAEVAPGEQVWRCLSVEGPEVWGGRISTFVEMLGMDGRRAVDVRVRWFNGGDAFKVSEPKPGDPFALDFPMYAAGNAYGVQIAAGQPSDTVFGFGLPRFEPHHVFRVVFQLVLAGSAGDPQGDIVPPNIPPTEPPAGMTALQAIEQAERYLALAKGLL